MSFIEDLHESGGEIYMVGGNVRNMCYNLIHNTQHKIKDHDLLVRLIDLKKLENILNKYGAVKLVGKSFGILKFKINGFDEFDIALPRTEIKSNNDNQKSHKNFDIHIDENIILYDDFSRRDATINAMGFRIYTTDSLLKNSLNNDDLNNVIDPFNGLNDIKNKLWRCVGNSCKRFQEDPTRILRALRQSSELNLIIEEKTLQSIYKNYLLLHITLKESIVRITNEFVKILNSNYGYVIDHIFDSKISITLELENDSYFILKRALNYKLNSRILISCALLPHKFPNNALHWIKKFQLSASPSFSKNNVLFVTVCCNLYKFINNDLTTIEMRKIIQKAEKIAPNYGILFTKDLITYYNVINNYVDDNNKLYDIYNNVSSVDNKYFILSVSQLKLTGNDINLENGLLIKYYKELYFDMITNEQIENNNIVLLDDFHKRNK